MSPPAGVAGSVAPPVGPDGLPYTAGCWAVGFHPCPAVSLTSSFHHLQAPDVEIFDSTAVSGVLCWFHHQSITQQDTELVSCEDIGLDWCHEHSSSASRSWVRSSRCFPVGRLAVAG